MTRTIYDVVQIVTPGARCSTPPGRHGADFTTDEANARRIAARFNEHRAITDGLRYVVECHDELCPGRPFGHLDPDAPDTPQTCTCGGGVIRP